MHYMVCAISINSLACVRNIAIPFFLLHWSTTVYHYCTGARLYTIIALEHDCIPLLYNKNCQHHYYVVRYWAVAAPTYLCMTIVFLVIFYVAYNFVLTPPLDSIHTITGSVPSCFIFIILVKAASTDSAHHESGLLMLKSVVCEMDLNE